MSRHEPVRATHLTLLALLAACGPGDAPDSPPTRPLTLLDYTSAVPVHWQEDAPRSSMRLAQFRVPGSGTDTAAAEVVVYFFGQGQGGSVEANTARWQQQFFDEEGGHPEPSVRSLDGTAFPTTVVELRGRYARAIGPAAGMGGGPEQATPDQVLLASVVETPQGSLFIQLHGPSEIVLAERRGYEDLVRGIRAP